MGTKQKISANGTYVLDAAEIEQLDELSLTSVVRAMGEGNPQEAPDAPNVVWPARLGDTTINELLSGQLEPDEVPSALFGAPVRQEPGEEPDDLIDAELLLPELATKVGKGS